MKYQRERNRQMYEMWSSGLSCAHIAREFKPITRQRVWQIVKHEEVIANAQAMVTDRN